MAPSPRRSLRGLVRFALGVPWLHFNPVNLANANKGVLGVNMGRMWDQQELLVNWGQQLVNWYEQGKLRVHVDRVFPLEDAAEAHRYLQARSNTGKVILRP
jgi:NADPH:quinone reductase-like Zn-dependent oxidoreductase